MRKEVDVVVIGAGSAGLAAVRQIRQVTDNFLLVNQGALGTTCARVGCMPSKALIQVAKDYHRREWLAEAGIRGSLDLQCDLPAVMEHVRRLRDRFASGMVRVTRDLAGERLVAGTARLLGPDRILLNGEEIACRRLVLAVGARPTVPEAWQRFGERLMTSDTVFEQRDFPKRLAVVGMGLIGLELGQALARLGVEVVGFGRNPKVGGISDATISRVARDQFARDLPLHLGSAVEVAEQGAELLVGNATTELRVDAVLVAVGVTPNVEGLGLENLGVELDQRGLPQFDPHTMQVADLPVFLVGDANGCRPILHEALDEGLIAGHNAVAAEAGRFCRRPALRIGFCDPQIAAVGKLPVPDGKETILTGVADFSEQSRAALEGRNAGRLHVYADRDSGRLLGGEMAVPEAEHLAHLLALAVQQQMTVHEALLMPFYHPAVEEGLRAALRDAARQMKDAHPAPELSLCGAAPERPLC